MPAYFNGQFLPEDQISIRWNDRGFNFSDGCYEVVRSYSGNIFRLEDHIRRLRHSLGELKINSDIPDKFSEIANRLLTENHPGHEHALVYLQVTRGAHKRMHRFPPQATPPTVLATSTAFAPYELEFNEGAGIILEEDIRWSRCDIKSIGLIPNCMAQQKAFENGAIEAVFVRNGKVTEGTHTNIACIKNGSFITPPLSNFILAGVTRQVVIEICHELNMPVLEKEIHAKDLYEMDELMVVGTTLEITPVISLDQKIVGDGIPEKYTRILQKSFREKTLS